MRCLHYARISQALRGVAPRVANGLSVGLGHIHRFYKCEKEYAVLDGGHGQLTVKEIRLPQPYWICFACGQTLTQGSQGRAKPTTRLPGRRDADRRRAAPHGRNQRTTPS